MKAIPTQRDSGERRYRDPAFLPEGRDDLPDRRRRIGRCRPRHLAGTILVCTKRTRAEPRHPNDSERDVPERAEHQREEEQRRLHRHRHVAPAHVLAVDEQPDHLVESEDVQPRDPGNLPACQQPGHAVGRPEVGDEPRPELHQQRADAEGIEHRDVDREERAFGQAPRSAPGGYEDQSNT